MDFGNNYTQEQDVFRSHVRSWLMENVPSGVYIPNDGRPIDPTSQLAIKEFRMKLGRMGWLAPSWPQEMGGAGLSESLEVVFREELLDLNLPSIGNNPRWIPAMIAWGTSDQKERYILPAVRGETITWQLFTEAESGTDLAAIQTYAVREDDKWVVNGHKDFITGRFDPDLLFTLAVTDVTRPQHINLGIFMIDAKLPGITIVDQDLLVGSERHVILDSVEVPDSCRIGGVYQGWEIAQTVLEGEREGLPLEPDDSATVHSIMRYLSDQSKT